MATDATTLTKTQLEATPGLGTLGSVLDEDETISVGELFGDAFVAEYTDFDTFDELSAASPTDGTTAELVSRSPTDDLDAFITEHSMFDSWTGFVRAAGDQFLHENSGY